MKRSHLKWLVPIVIYLIAVAIILSVYKGIIYKRAASAKLTEMALAISKEVRDKDIVMSEAISAMTMSGRAMSLYAMNYNSNQIKVLLKSLMDETELIYALVCDSDGKGYDYLGKEISIGNKEYFQVITSEYSRGGTGMVLPDRSENSRNTETLIVSGVRFENRDSGYLVATLPVNTIADQLFKEHFILDKCAVVTLNGDIFADDMNDSPEAFSVDASFWEQIPPGISRDTIKLSISQKNVYMGAVPGYGYAVVSPFSSAAGGVVAFVDEKAMRAMTDETMNDYSAEAFKLIIASAGLIALIMLSYYLSDVIEKRVRKKLYETRELDELSGLLTKESAVAEIGKYANAEGSKRGILFVLQLPEIQDARQNRGDVFADEKIKEFSRTLYGRFRASDIVSRYDDDKFMVFLKDIYDQKDIRKQTDEMQLFLHDSRFFDEDKEVTPNAGAAIYPDNGRNVPDILAAAEKALERSKTIGRGILSF